VQDSTAPNTDSIRREDLLVLIDSVSDLHELRERVAARLEGSPRPQPGSDDLPAATDNTVANLPIVIRMTCLDCEGEINTETLRHVYSTDGCLDIETDVEDDVVAVALHCPHCDSQDLYEVNVGEAWDEIANAFVSEGMLVIDVHQRGGMDREGDGYLCNNCSARLLEPSIDIPVDWAYS
jgi:hypothetical protein